MSKVVFDIGGSSMRVAAAEGGAPLRIERARTPEDPDEGFEVLARLIKEVSEGKADEIVGGVPGIVGSEGALYRLPNLPKWNGKDLSKFLRKEICESVRLENDVALAGVAEARFGAGEGSSIVGYIRVGTGVGGARIVRGNIDAHVFGFEPGQHILDVEHGTTLENMVSGKALFEKLGAPSEELPHHVYEDLKPAFAAGLYNAVLFWSPETLVLDGPLVNDENGFSVAHLSEALEKINTMLPALPEIKKGVLGDEAGLRGAAALLSG